MIWKDVDLCKFDIKLQHLAHTKMDIPEEKTDKEGKEVGVGSKKSSFWSSLREKQKNEGLIVPHLHFIGN